MQGGHAPAPREQGWLRLFLALAAFLLVPYVPVPYFPLTALLPVAETLLLLVPAVSVCFVLGWLGGGSLGAAAAWVALTAVQALLPPPNGVSGAYYDVARACGLIVAGVFGLVCLVGGARRFLDRALAAIGVAALLALIATTAGRLDLGRVRRVFHDELAMRNAAMAASMQASARVVGARAPTAAALAEEYAASQTRLRATVSRAAEHVYPALLALEALAALALAWALYGRLGRARIGGPLAPLREFGFSDQLTWAVVAGITFLVLPSFAPLAALGENLIVFFGALFVLRGYGVYAWFTSRRVATASAWVAAAIFPLSLLTVPPALGLGLTDSWFDWRHRARPGRRDAV